MTEPTDAGHYSRERSRLISDEAFSEILHSGVLNQRSRQALVALRRIQPATAHEVTREAGVPGLWKRLSELADQGAVTSNGERTCRCTGKLAQVWVITGDMPRAREKGGSELRRKRVAAAEWLDARVPKEGIVSLDPKVAAKIAALLRGRL